jgi:hypothetical protein
MTNQPDDNNVLSFIAATVEGIRDEMATKRDLAQMATKNDLAQTESRLVQKIEVETTAIRGDMSKSTCGSIASNASRLRSVV